jgi:hypothetical protein
MMHPPLEEYDDPFWHASMLVGLSLIRRALRADLDWPTGSAR